MEIETYEQAIAALKSVQGYFEESLPVYSLIKNAEEMETIHELLKKIENATTI